MRNIGLLLIAIGIVPALAPTVYAMLAAFKDGAEPDRRLISLGLSITMVGLPLAMVGAAMIIVSWRRRRQPAVGGPISPPPQP